MTLTIDLTLAEAARKIVTEHPPPAEQEPRKTASDLLRGDR